MVPANIFTIICTNFHFHLGICTLNIKFFFVTCFYTTNDGSQTNFDTQITIRRILMKFSPFYLPWSFFYRVYVREACLMLAFPQISTENTRNIRRVSWKITKIASHCLGFFHLLFMLDVVECSLPSLFAFSAGLYISHEHFMKLWIFSYLKGFSISKLHSIYSILFKLSIL